ncbi:cation:dicarboxylate symporter family transporter [Bremerella sp. P1]|uniref:cation:dicarboxylate symporter family transporter n=1 Tax=Bremerella sp. P1 TaxID=3026424 RepID=UPI002367D792|nr:cation:dicarboxylase symporter family transporter [Bremerella sp. P1]WDI43073.1 cation:dicarboxylase symporter family transporter [Bremerella sp. P1]
MNELTSPNVTKPEDAQPKKKRKFRLNLSTSILIGLTLGILCGVFFGESCAWLGIIGRAYVGLLQMSILPYMMVSLIGGIGTLVAAKAIRLALTAGLVLLGSWILAFICVFLAPLAYPVVEAGSFFSPSMTQVKEIDFINLYIPINPFRSMAETIVPAVAVFSVVVGVALIGIETDKKRVLLDLLSVASMVLTRVAVLVVRLAPFGLFAIAANAAGTMTIQELGRLQVYIGSFILLTLLLTFFVMPAMVAIFTPFRFGDVLRASRSAMLTGFVTGNLFIVLPLLIEHGKMLFERAGLRTDDTDSYIEVLIPVSFNFPNLGKLLTLAFVLFAGWYTGNQVGFSEYPTFSVLGLFSLFGGVDLALPFLLDQMRIPSDTYQLYVVTGVVNGWFATLLATMNLFAFTLIATSAATGNLKIKLRQCVILGTTATVLTVAVLLAARVGFSSIMGKSDIAQETLMQMQVKSDVETRVLRIANETEPTTGEGSRLDQILNRGVLRVGYHPDMYPFCFFNDSDQLVGYDVALMHELASTLDLKLEFIPWTYETRDDQLKSGQIDVAIGGLMVTPERLARMALTDSYMTITAAIVIEDHRRDAVGTWDDLRELDGFRLAATGRRLSQNVKRHLPETDVVYVDSPRDFFHEPKQPFDAILMTAEGGSAYTILYPGYDVAIPKPQFKGSVAFAIPSDERGLEKFFNAWLALQETNGTLSRHYDKWIIGQVASEESPRWCVIRDVLHWVE